MKQTILLFLLTALDCFGQNISTKFIPAPDFVEFEGTIDSKFKIGMYLTIQNENVIGTYFYNKVKKEIDLLGTFENQNAITNNGLEKKSKIVLIRYDKYKKQVETFEGELRDDTTFTGTWKDCIKNKTSPFNLKISNRKTLPKNLKFSLEVKVDTFSYAFNFNTKFGYKPQVDTFYYLKKENKHHLLILASYFSLGRCNSIGSCGCGQEKYLIYVTFDSNFDSKSEQLIFYESCSYDIMRDINVYLPDKKIPIEISKFDFKKFDKLEVELSSRLNERISLELNSNCLDCGFKMTKKEILKD